MRHRRRLLFTVSVVSLLLLLASCLPLTLLADEHFECGCVGECTCGYSAAHAACARKSANDHGPKLKSCHTDRDDSVTTGAYELSVPPKVLSQDPLSEKVILAELGPTLVPHLPETPPPESRFASSL